MVRINLLKPDMLNEATPEVSVSVYLNKVLVAVSQATPCNLEEFAVGYLLSERLISDRELFQGVELDEATHSVFVFTDEVKPTQEYGFTHLTSSGALLSFSSSRRSKNLPLPLSDNLRLNAANLYACMEKLCKDSPLRNAGECTHGCGLGAVELDCVREDIGRHNALDKLFGQAWLDRLSVQDRAVFTTGRISYEVLLKVARGGASTLVSRKGITDSAVQLAEDLKITTAAYCRDESMTIFTHPERIIQS